MNKPEKPPVTSQTIEQVYKYYENNSTNERFANAALSMMGLLFRTNVSMWSADGKEYIEKKIDDRAGIVLAPNHLTAHDQYVVASIPNKIPSLNRVFVGHAFVPTKTELFRQDSMFYKSRRWALEQLGAVPAYRAKDFDTADDPRRTLATNLLLSTSVKRLDRGQHMAIFGEGTRNKEQPYQVQKIRRGIGEIACTSVKKDNLLILPIGIVYGNETPKKQRSSKKMQKRIDSLYELKNALHPMVHVGEPLEGPFETPDQVTDMLQKAIQSSVDIALERRDGNIDYHVL